MGIAVVDAPVAAGGRDDLVGELSNGELAEVLRDRVVRPVGGRVGGLPVDGVRVVARADGGLAAGGREAGGLVIHEALDGACGGQGLAVVDPCGVGRGDRQSGRRDGNGAGVRGHVELGGDVVALGVGDHRGALDGALVGAGVGALGGRGQAGDGVLDAVELEDVGVEPGHRLLLAAVGGGAGLGLHHDLTLRELTVIEGYILYGSLIDSHRKWLRRIVGITLDRDNILREVKRLSRLRSLGCNLFILGDRYTMIERVDVMENDRTKVNRIKVDVAIKMPR